MSLGREVWVIVPDNGLEGLGEPVAAFDQEWDAKNCNYLIENSGMRYRVVRVPRWPYLTECPNPVGAA